MREKPLILVVDDDADFLEVIATKFAVSGFQVVTAADGEEGVNQAKKLKPDLILMDVKMPKVDGIAAMLKLREDPETKKIKVILLTAFGDPQPEVYKTDRRFAKELGAVEYILKSEDLDAIVEKTKEYLTK